MRFVGCCAFLTLAALFGAFCALCALCFDFNNTLCRLSMLFYPVWLYFGLSAGCIPSGFASVRLYYSRLSWFPLLPLVLCPLWGFWCGCVGCPSVYGLYMPVFSVARLAVGFPSVLPCVPFCGFLWLSMCSFCIVCRKTPCPCRAGVRSPHGVDFCRLAFSGLAAVFMKMLFCLGFFYNSLRFLPDHVKIQCFP